MGNIHAVHGLQIETWFVVKGEAINIAMVESSLTDARQAAKQLEAKFFFRRNYDTAGPRETVWDIFSVARLGSTPVKTMRSPDTDGPVMFCIAMEAMG